MAKRAGSLGKDPSAKVTLQALHSSKLSVRQLALATTRDKKIRHISAKADFRTLGIAKQLNGMYSNLSAVF